MTNKTEETYIDKSSWLDGPWKNEPDKVSWVDPETGYRCLVTRHNTLGHLCGYVCVDKGHPFYEKDYQYNDFEICDKLECHGGVTFTGFDDNKIWKIGFDCAHLYDIRPGILNDIMNFPLLEDRGHYKTISYVTKQVESLARQLKECEKNHE